MVGTEATKALKSKEITSGETTTTGGNTSIAESLQPDSQNVIIN